MVWIVKKFVADNFCEGYFLKIITFQMDGKVRMQHSLKVVGLICAKCVKERVCLKETRRLKMDRETHSKKVFVKSKCGRNGSKQ